VGLCGGEVRGGGVVHGEIGIGDREIEEVVFVGEMEGAGVGEPTRALFEDVGDVVAGEGVVD